MAKDLQQYSLAYYDVSRRMVRMNKRLYDKLEERVAEQRGYHWALTSFAVKAWGETEAEKAKFEDLEAWK